MPEIRHTKPAVDRLYELPRASYDSSIRSNEYSTTKSLAPSPLLQNGRNPSPTYERSMTPPQRSPVHPNPSHSSSRFDLHIPLRSGPPTRSSGSSLSSEFSDRRGSLASAASSAAYPSSSSCVAVYSSSSSATYPPYSGMTREQPLSAGLPALRGPSNGALSENEGFDQRNLPSLFGNIPGGPMSPYAQERAPFYGSGHHSAQTYPPARQAYSLPAPEQQAYASGGDIQSRQYPYPPTQYADRSPFMNGSANGQYPLNYDTGSELGEPKHKRRRGNLPKTVTDIMRAWFQDHIAHPYPTEEEKQFLMHRTGLTISQVSAGSRV